MTAMCGLTSIVMSWKLDSSSTAQSVCAISPASHSSGVADVAADVDGLPRRAQQLRDDRGRRGLAVRSGHGDDRAGADMEKLLHLRGQNAPARHSLAQLRHVRPQAGGTEDNVLRQVLEIPIPELQRGARALQLTGQPTQIRAAAPVAGGNGDPLPAKQLHQRGIAHTDSDHGDGLAAQGNRDTHANSFRHASYINTDYGIV